MDLEGIESGSPEFTKIIVKAIGDSTAVLFFLSETSQESKWPINELRVACKQGKHIVIVKFNDVSLLPDFELEFGGTDIIDWREPEQKEKLFRDFDKWIKRRPPCSTDGLKKALVARGDWEKVKSFMEESDVWESFCLANRVDFDHPQTKQVVAWLKNELGYTDNDIDGILSEARMFRHFTKLGIKEALTKRGIWEEARAYMKAEDLLTEFLQTRDIDEDHPFIHSIMGWLKTSVGCSDEEVEAILSEADRSYSR